jgi:hypothetical protein
VNIHRSDAQLRLPNEPRCEKHNLMKCFLCTPKVAAKPAPVAAVPVPATLTLKQPPVKISAPAVVPIQQAASVEPMKARDIIRHTLDRRYAQGEIIEVRGLVPQPNGENVIHSGVYTDRDAILRDVKWLMQTTPVSAIYTNLQRIKNEAESAVTNTMGTGRNCASASDIERYDRLLIDVDTARPKGFEKSSSTDEEKARAFDVITKAKNYMESLGLAGDLYDSGNGYHNVYALDLPATKEHKLLIKAVLASLAAQFDTQGAHIDTSVFDMPRVCKLIGSYARKGENTTERGGGVCAHGRKRAFCKECGGSQICEHGRRRYGCVECGGPSICEHRRRRSQCKECGSGLQICKHRKRRSVCVECGGSQICEHKRLHSTCKECRGSEICEHGRRRTHCKECGTYLRFLANGFTKEQIQTMARVTVCEYPGCSNAAGDRGLDADHAHGQPCERDHHRNHKGRACPKCYRGSVCRSHNTRLGVLETRLVQANDDDIEYMTRRPFWPRISVAA